MTLAFKLQPSQLCVVDMKTSHDESADDEVHRYRTQKGGNFGSSLSKKMSVTDSLSSGTGETSNSLGLDGSVSKSANMNPSLDSLVLPALDHMEIGGVKKKLTSDRFSKNQSAPSLIERKGEFATKEGDDTLTVEETHSLSIPHIEQPAADLEPASNSPSTARLRPVQLAFRSRYGREIDNGRGRPPMQGRTPMETQSHVIPDSPDAYDGFPSYQGYSDVDLSGHDEENRTDWTFMPPGL